MLAHDIKQILSLLPEAQSLVKKADLVQDYPLDNVDGCIASNLRYAYRVKVAHKTVDPDLAPTLEKAAKLYGVTETVQEFAQKLDMISQQALTKIAEAVFDVPLEQAQANFEGNLTGFHDVQDLVKQAEALSSTYGDKITSEEVKRYSGNCYFDKEAAVASLVARANFTGRPVFSKFAEIIDKGIDGSEQVSSSEIRSICSKITELDKSAGLDKRGFNIYKEALFTKEARLKSALLVKVAGKKVPYESIMKLGSHRIGSILGDDVGKSITGNPYQDKAVIESLPLDSQRVLAGVLKGV